MNDHFNLSRFVDAQTPVYARVCAELKQGEKASHWMWYIFPQIHGLGNSLMARKYAIASLDEAKSYLLHPVLGDRLRECTGLVNQISGRTVQDIFYDPDDLKFHSSMTLFALAADKKKVFQTALETYFEGALDRATLDILGL